MLKRFLAITIAALLVWGAPVDVHAANVKIKDADGSDKYMSATGAGSNGDPYVPAHSIAGVALDSSLTTIAGYLDGVEALLTTINAAVTSPLSVTGTVTANLGTLNGAATAAKQPALGTAGSASSDVISVQGIASMTPLLVNGSGATQPVSGTFWQATQPVSGTLAATQSGTWTVQPGNTANTTPWKVDGSAVTQPVSGFDQVVVTNTPSVSGSAIATNENMGGLQSIANAVRTTAGYGIVVGILVSSLDTVSIPMDIIFYDANPSATTFTDSSAQTINDADLVKIVGTCNVSNWRTFADNRSAYADCNVPFKLASGTTLYSSGIANSGATTSSSSNYTYRYIIRRF